MRVGVLAERSAALSRKVRFQMDNMAISADSYERECLLCFPQNASVSGRFMREFLHLLFISACLQAEDFFDFYQPCRCLKALRKVLCGEQGED